MSESGYKRKFQPPPCHVCLSPNRRHSLTDVRAYRELDDAVELTEMAGDVLTDGRTSKNGRHDGAVPSVPLWPAWWI